jgi:hypothetical protein
MFNKYVFISILFILAILLIILGIYLFKSDSYKSDSYKSNSYKILNNIDESNECNECSVEKFSSTIKENYDNLIENGNFENGSDITNTINKSGINKIISKSNPGKSSYVLHQQKSNELTFYQITCDSVKNSKYIFLFWICVSNNDNKIVENLNNMNFQNLIKIKILNEDNTSYNAKLNFKIIQKIITDNNQSAWFLIRYDFISGPNVQNTMNLYLNYNENIMFDNFYFTNVSLYRSLIDAENFIYNKKLISYVDGYHYESNTETWHDLSGTGNDLFWSSIPKVDHDKGCINIFNYKLTGFSSNKFISDKFCILMALNKGNNDIDDYTHYDNDTDNDKYLISIPGNDKYAFELKLIDKHLHLIYDSNDIISSREIILYNKGLLSVLFNNNNINIFHDGINILSTTIRKCYFNTDKIIINRNKNLNLNLYSLLFFNRTIETDELDKIREYFIMTNNKNFTKIDINIYHMSANAEYSAIYDKNHSLVNPHDKKKIYDNYEEDNDITFDNIDTRMKTANGLKCFNDCKNLCNIFLKNGNSSKYNECISNCKNVLDSCNNYCNIEKNKSSPYCTGTFDGSQVADSQCPTVSIKDGSYIVYLSPNTYYANLYNYSGERNYGKSMARARRLYHINFPKCPIPDILIPSGGQPFNNACPYVVNELNPCHVSACADVNWDVDDFNNLNLGKPCKKVVSNYCQINYELDDKCVCWDPKYKDDPKCNEFRRYFEDPTDYCAPSQFNIEDHPDFNKYIKKDNIPCWGCTVDSIDDGSD